MNAVEVGPWSANWAWSLPLIVLSVVILVIGLGLINEGVVRVLSGAMVHRHFIFEFAAAHEPYCELAAILQGTEAAVWATSYWLLGALQEEKGGRLHKWITA